MKTLRKTLLLFSDVFYGKRTLVRRSRGRRAGKIKIQKAQKSVDLKHCPVLRGIFEFKPASQFVERYRRLASCVLKWRISLRTIYVNSVSNEINF
jgi:hypothetical protein